MERTGNRTCRRSVLVQVLLAAFATSVPAQINTGEIGGVVRDESGSVLPGATVVATHSASGFSAERVTDAAGRFFMASLPTGEWRLTAELPGFRRMVQTGVVLEIGSTLDLRFDLDLGQISEEVTVTAGVPILQTTSAEISDVIENREVEQIPLNGRQFLRLAQLSRCGRHPTGRHPRGGSAAGRPAAQRRRAARRAQHLPAGRLQDHRRAVTTTS